jgi:hypothetical protein
MNCQSDLLTHYSKYELQYNTNEILHIDSWPVFIRCGTIVDVEPPEIEN